MTNAPALRVRRSIADIQADYDAGRKTELETLMRAWKGIKELGPNEFNSFFMIGGFHGEPFRGPGAQTPAWWGGYCQHGTVLFPTWHRAYLHRLESALRSIPGCESVTLPFWDETSTLSRKTGIPRALTDETFVLDGQTIPNPLRSFTLPATIVDAVTGDNDLYTKPQDYTTVRYPLSGLVGTPADRAATAAHNALYPTPSDQTRLLNGNIMNWLNTSFTVGGNTVGLIYQKFIDCLNTPTYTLFSNTTSAANWNNANPKALVVALESPHNSMHLAVGGFDVPGQGTFSPIAGANGDMGENDTAGLDPIFYFHHCFIDYVFWIWQRRHNATDTLAIDAADPGAKYGAQNQPPAGADPNATMAMTTPLEPFFRQYGVPYTSADVVNIEKQLGYTYGPASLDTYAAPPGPQVMAAVPTAVPGQTTVHVAGIDRSKIRGSFLVATWAELDGRKQLVGLDPVLSRWQTAGCANCQTKLRVTSDVALPPGADPASVAVEVHTRDGLLGHGPSPGSVGLLPETLAMAAAPQPFTVEIR
ncbi:tyrosinase family protein [Acidisphaera rubrifaciens]|uniref:Tyrosinase n=1 Tax=Acidisphaera rubrifaciens HS-AP3 TaxID=1231350 RepID=A0A0D6P930_9PROT|nr:tyrosinase family protein [Acidisphaera rubrifaciens]GAN78162.1 tyrosinase [Acidisphaera rubrifaciens HS-AP3]